MGATPRLVMSLCIGCVFETVIYSLRSGMGGIHHGDHVMNSCTALTFSFFLLWLMTVCSQNVVYEPGLISPVLLFLLLSSAGFPWNNPPTAHLPPSFDLICFGASSSLGLIRPLLLFSNSARPVFI